MFIIIGIMLTGMLLGYLLRSKRLSWIHRIITLLIWILLFLLGIDVGGNESIIKGLHTRTGSYYHHGSCRCRKYVMRLGIMVPII